LRRAEELDSPLDYHLRKVFTKLGLAEAARQLAAY
jgi:hypothetical protein